MPSRRKYDRKLAAKYIREEVMTNKYPIAQARAIGISRAVAEEKKRLSRISQLVLKYK